MKFYTIPFFILHKGCPHDCIFCDQKKITGQEVISPDEIHAKIKEYLDTFPKSNARIEVGFFGGSFTGLSMKEQREFLSPVAEFIDKGMISGIRLSTRPDLITGQNLDLLADFRVKCIELGVQSMKDEVLIMAKRGHTKGDTLKASKLILEKGFTLGHQIMLGLPGSTREDEYYTAKCARDLGAKEVRIYPVIVIKDTGLSHLWEDKKYTPLTEIEAIIRARDLLIYFEANNIKVIRCGLHPSEGLIDGTEFLDGPFHPAFRLKAESKVFGVMLDFLRSSYTQKITVEYNPQDEAAFFGFERSNAPKIEGLKGYNKNSAVPRGSIKVETEKEIFILNKGTVAQKMLPEILK